MCVLLASIPMCFSNARGATPGELMYESFVTGEMHHWRQALVMLERERTVKTDFNRLWNLAMARYGYAGFCIMSEQADQARLMVDSGWILIDQLQDIVTESGPLEALKGAYYELEMALSPIKVPYYGPLLYQTSKRSIELAPSDAYCLAERALFLWHAPAWVKGDRIDALLKYEQAIVLMEKHRQQREWYYLHTLTLLAQAYASLKKIDQARATFEKIIRLEPRYKRVTEKIYPAFRSRYALQ